jgi:hypothetical protein
MDPSAGKHQQVPRTTTGDFDGAPGQKEEFSCAAD